MSLTTTTYAAIRDQMVSKIEALTPTLQSQFGFKRSKQSRSIRQWTKTTAAFRGFEITSGSETEPEFMDPSARLVTQTIDVTIAYPTAWAMFGVKDRDDAEELIKSDAQQIRDALFSPGNYASGQLAAIPQDRESIDDADDDVWFQTLSFTVTYYASQSLT